MGEFCHPKIYAEVYIPVSVKVPLFGNRVFADAVNLAGGHTGIEWALSSTRLLFFMR